MASTTVYATVGDGYVENGNADFTTARNAATGSAVDYTAAETYVLYSQPSNKFFRRVFLSFDTSALTSSATITACDLHLYMGQSNATTCTLRVVPSTQSSTTTLSTSDYSAFTYTDCGSISLGSVAKADRTISLNSTGLSNINKTGFTKFALIGQNDWQGSFHVAPEQWSLDTFEGTNKAYLVITYTLPNVYPALDLAGD